MWHTAYITRWCQVWYTPWNTRWCQVSDTRRNTLNISCQNPQVRQKKKCQLIGLSPAFSLFKLTCFFFELDYFQISPNLASDVRARKETAQELKIHTHTHTRPNLHEDAANLASMNNTRVQSTFSPSMARWMQNVVLYVVPKKKWAAELQQNYICVGISSNIIKLEK